MIKKGIISTVNVPARTVTLVFRDLDNAVSGPLPVNPAESILQYQVGGMVVAAFFSGDLTDGVVLCRIGGG